VRNGLKFSIVGSVGDALPPIGGFFNLILCSLVMLLNDAAPDLFKPTLRVPSAPSVCNANAADHRRPAFW
jgi:hypothetical protein